MSDREQPRLAGRAPNDGGEPGKAEMSEREQERQERFEREKLVMRYADALELGDLDSMAVILERAETDPELEQSLWEIQTALGEILQEEQAAAVVEMHQRNEAQVAALAESHFGTPVTQTPPPAEGPRTLTLGDLAAAIRRQLGLEASQRDRLKFWERSEELAELPRSQREVRTLLERLGVNAPVKALIAQVHEALLALGMQRQGPEVRLAAARRQRSNRVKPGTADNTKGQAQSLEAEEPDRAGESPAEEQS